MLRTTTLGKVIARTVRKRGWEPSVWTGTGSDYDLFEDALNDAIRRAYSYQKWPELMRIEERQFMPSWLIAQPYVAGNYVYHAEAYWKCLKSDTGTEPGTDDTVWSADVSDMPRIVQLAQPWELYIIDEDGFDLSDFAFPTDPRLRPGIRAMQGLATWMGSVVIPAGSGNTVWIKFMPQAPSFSFKVWVDDTDYVKGELCYVLETGKCWMALEASTNVIPGEDANKWIEVGVPEFLAEYLSEYLMGEWVTEQEGKYEKLGKAQQILEEVAARKFERRGGDGTPVRISMAR